MSDSDTDSKLSAAVAESHIVGGFKRAGDHLVRVGRSKRADRLATWSRHVGANSSLCRWLTTDNDPEMIVIDLRETHAAGPVVAILDRVLVWLHGSATSSSLVALIRSLSTEFRAAPTRLVGTVLLLGCSITLLVGTILGPLGVAPIVFLTALGVLGLAGIQVIDSWAYLNSSLVGRVVTTALEPSDAVIADSRPNGTDKREPPE